MSHQVVHRFSGVFDSPESLGVTPAEILHQEILNSDAALTNITYNAIGETIKGLFGCFSISLAHLRQFMFLLFHLLPHSSRDFRLVLGVIQRTRAKQK